MVSYRKERDRKVRQLERETAATNNKELATAESHIEELQETNTQMLKATEPISWQQQLDRINSLANESTSDRINRINRINSAGATTVAGTYTDYIKKIITELEDEVDYQECNQE